jgi:N-methylhydantoinase A
MKRLAVDTGGTFTDIVYVDDKTMKIVVNKVPTTPQDLERGVLESVKKIKVKPSEVTLFTHGTTAGLNTIAQRTGAKVGFITTRNFIDIPEMTISSRKDVYNYLWKKTQPLVPRHLRLGVTERTNHQGKIIEPLDEAEVREMVNKFKAAGVEAIAVCLLHAYANPANEKRIGEIIREMWPEVGVSISHQAACEIGENIRANTTILSAYSGKAISAYIVRLEENLKGMGFKGQLLILGPNGVMGIQTAREKPLTSLSSGPVGGAAGAAQLANLCGIKDVVTIDVGGTSFDVSIIKNGVNVERHKSEIMGFPVFISGIDIMSIGAGGGSIARVDTGGLLTVGPESAGANPGPMAYGLGATEPTVTDAAFVNGLIDPNYFLGGEIKLNLDLAVKGIKTIAEKLNISLYNAADGILAVARNNMTLATSEILIGQGHDPRDFTIMAFGGGGGIFAGTIARDMSIAKAIIPTDPGVFCARGILTMDIVHTYAQSFTQSLDKLDFTELGTIFKEIENQAYKTLIAEGTTGDEIKYNRTIEMGYEDQYYFIETPVPGGALEESVGKEIGESFESLHEARYGHRIKAPLKITRILLKATGKIKDLPVKEIRKGKSIPAGALKKKREVYLDGEFVEANIFERGRLTCGNIIPGPAIIEEPFHTTVVMAGQNCEVDKYGNLIIHTGGV